MNTDTMQQTPIHYHLWHHYKHVILLIAILLLASGLRFWNVNYDSDLSMVFSGDARTKFFRARSLAFEGKIPINPDERYRLYLQPFFLIRSYALIWKTINAVGMGNNDEQMRQGFTAYMILFSLGTVILVFFLGKIVLEHPHQALFASLLFSLFPVNVAGSLYVKEDIPLMFWFTASMTALCTLIHTNKTSAYLGSGALIGLAIGTKYTGFLLLPLFLVTHLVVVFNASRKNRVKTLFSWQFFVSNMITILVFLILNPHVMTEWSDFWQGFIYQLHYTNTGHHDGTIIRGADHWWMFYLRYAILPGITFPATVLFLLGFVISAIKRTWDLILISLTILFVYFQFENSLAKPFPFFARYLHMLYPLMAVLTAMAFFELRRLFFHRTPYRRIVGLMLGLVIVLFPLWKSTILAAGIHQPDTRILAARWIKKHLPSDSRIYLGRYCPQGFDQPGFNGSYTRNLHEKTLQKMQKEQVDYIVVSSFDYERYRFSLHSSEKARQAIQAYEDFEQNLKLIRVFQPRFSFQTYGQHNPVIRIYKVPSQVTTRIEFKKDFRSRCPVSADVARLKIQESYLY